jgi:hypothetical protein
MSACVKDGEDETDVVTGTCTGGGNGNAVTEAVIGALNVGAALERCGDRVGGAGEVARYCGMVIGVLLIDSKAVGGDG